MKNSRPANRLIHETSAYLLQHAHNPVDWHPWNDETLSKAKSEDKMILVSIGYSACHWCHVMEHESFEDESVARVMNEHFICIKVDREERPDVDQVYMDAVQLLSGRGGWPLNCFAMPDGRPVWGGTYFRKDQWLEVLENINLLFLSSRDKLERQADELFAGIRENHFIGPRTETVSPLEKKIMDDMAVHLMARIDHEYGGFRGAPKFPMPNNLLFLLRYAWFSKKEDIKASVDHTLGKLAAGGIYDQLGGGFARYSVDDRWHVPHFEKMLYDNAQLVSLYAEAYRFTGDPLYVNVIHDTLAFINRELTSPEGAFYSALDADSEGVEGKYYVWTKEEFDRVLGADAPLLSEYFGIDGAALWEDNNNVLVRNKTKDELVAKFGLTPKEVSVAISRGKKKLLEARRKRVRPGLDDKILTSWNALMLKAYVDAYRALDNTDYLEAALRNAQFLRLHRIREDGSVIRSGRKGTAPIIGFLDDYAFLIEAFISLYEVTMDAGLLSLSDKLMEYALRHFYDTEKGIFYYSSDQQTDSMVRKAEVTDNVIPASTSSMARALHVLGLLLEKPSYTAIEDMLISIVRESMQRYPSAFTNWGMLGLNLVYPFHTVVVAGPDAGKFIHQMKTVYLPNVVFAGSESFSKLAILSNRWDREKTRIFICTGEACLEPVSRPEVALQMLNADFE
jgi:uncharacterized protein YyaL (SSP411 family)